MGHCFSSHKVVRAKLLTTYEEQAPRITHLSLKMCSLLLYISEAFMSVLGDGKNHLFLFQCEKMRNLTNLILDFESSA